MSIIERGLEKLDEQRPRDPRSADEGRVPEPGAAAAPLPPALAVAVPKESDAPPRGEVPGAGDVGERPVLNGKEQRSREVSVNLQEMVLSGLLTPDRPQSQLSEEMRQVKRPLLSKLETPVEGADPRYKNLILVTSSLPGEGKTFTTINLAISIAMEMDKTVLLVDTDAAKSDVVKRLGIDAARGLTDYLTNDDVKLADVLLRTNIPKLTVLPAGAHHDHMTELLASGGMKKLVDDLATRYSDRVVVFDSSPVLVTSGTAVLASLVGQIVFVVRAEKTLASQVKDALRQLKRRDSLGIVLNRSREWGGGQAKYGSYYYYYQRGD
jgi:exopolysaccharide/PEP-CTERM locus tyrosine autokinase